MIVTHSCNLPTITLPNTALSGVQLVSEDDYKGFTAYEARIEAGESVPLRSPDHEACVHYYYVISGSGKCVKNGGKGEFLVGPDQLVALSSDLTHTLSTEGAMRVFVVYYPDAELAFKSLELVRSLSEVVGNDREVDWVTGVSRRFTIKQDGFPLGIHNTLVRQGLRSRFQYRNHIEGVYYLSGQATYHWQDDSGQWTSERSKVDEGNGTNYLMNIHDKHIVEIHEEDAICICIFDPVLTGKETHHHSKDGFSSYEASM
ncbi:uncharacterized protein LOC110975849 [Acanthaster planci]|uniref:L-ectoine synthase n=1 Tax=Acanthaster planci TaxID=133434 RepID=A0A8B7XVV2_ACAPL|nr:uncharacterized protein LOC110975849 [Acanthaster planci]